MNIIVSTNNVKNNVSPFKKEITAKLQDIEDKYKAKLIKAEVVLEERVHNRFSAEVVLYGSNINLDAKAETKNMYESIALVAERIEAQLYKLLDKQQSHR